MRTAHALAAPARVTEQKEPTNRAENPVAGVAETAAAPPARSSSERRTPCGARAASTDGAARVGLGEAPPVAFPLTRPSLSRCSSRALSGLSRSLPRSPLHPCPRVPVSTSTQTFPNPSGLRHCETLRWPLPRHNQHQRCRRCQVAHPCDDSRVAGGASTAPPPPIPRSAPRPPARRGIISGSGSSRRRGNSFCSPHSIR